MKIISLTKGYKTIVDDEDYQQLIKYKWQYHNGYAKRGKYNKLKKNNDNIKIHRQITNCPDNKVVHHINHNRLDNRKVNLLICDSIDNRRSQKNSKLYVSKYQGVIFHKKTGAWNASIKVNYKTIYLGNFRNMHHAGMAYNIAAKKYFGEFAVLNDIPKEYQNIPTKEERRKNSLKNLKWVKR